MRSIRHKNYWYGIKMILVLGIGIFTFLFPRLLNLDEGVTLAKQQLTEYHPFVKAKDGAVIYRLVDGKYEMESIVHGDIELSLDPSYQIINFYYKLLDCDCYIPFDQVVEIDHLSPISGEYQTYRNYVVYNENIQLKKGAKLYVDEENYYEVDGGSYPIVIRENNRYGIQFHSRLVYVSKNDVLSIKPMNNTSFSHADSVTVLNYHYTVSSTNENGELDECKQSICITDTMFDQQIKYLKEQGYYGVSIRDLELFIDGKIQLPERSVGITIDDGWYVARSIAILEKYQMLGTLFLIGSLDTPDHYVSNYLEIHSHSWNLHQLGDCPSYIGRGGILCLPDDVILEDLRRSRESLNQSPYFCYPFYDSNDRAIELLKRAGFTMAFAGEKGDSKVRVGQDKFKIPRYVIVNTTTMEDFIRYVS